MGVLYSFYSADIISMKEKSSSMLYLGFHQILSIKSEEATNFKIKFP